jgi:NAD(P)-dependent dehydrogenase (short-subunit alcohol dehydrogenase family)
LWVAFLPAAFAADELAAGQMSDGTAVPYVLTANTPSKIAFAVILMPGGKGILNPRMENGKIALAAGGNFLIRSRGLFADGRFVAASTDATSTPDRIRAIVQDLERRYGKLDVYVVGTSRSTEATMSLTRTMDGQVAGFVHSSSMNGISGLDPRGLKSRHLIVVHEKDGCRATNPTAGQSSAAKFGTALIVMEGGKTSGDDCEAFAHHGFNGIEKETVGKIKDWIVQGR